MYQETQLSPSSLPGGTARITAAQLLDAEIDTREHAAACYGDSPIRRFKENRAAECVVNSRSCKSNDTLINRVNGYAIPIDIDIIVNDRTDSPRLKIAITVIRFLF